MTRLGNVAALAVAFGVGYLILLWLDGRDARRIEAQQRARESHRVAVGLDDYRRRKHLT